MTNWPTQERDRSHKTQASKDKTTDQDPKATPDMENRTEVTHKTKEISKAEATHKTEEISKAETTHEAGTTPNQETTLDPTKATTGTGHKTMSNLKTGEEDHKREEDTTQTLQDHRPHHSTRTTAQGADHNPETELHPTYKSPRDSN